MIKAFAITGPTASGKTAISLDIAEALGCEIISCDSMQIYRGMDIGTAKATAVEQARAPHHMIDILDPTENYSAESYRRDALKCAREIEERGKIPLFVGGTGLYIDTVMRGALNSSPESDPEYRENLLSGIRCDEDKIALWKRLSEVDPKSAEKTHYNNVKRVIRALEIYDKTGRSKSELDNETNDVSPDIDVRMITLDFFNRENLYARVDKRVDVMMSEGLFSEVRSLYEAGKLPDGSTAAQAIGYKEIISALRGECTVEEAAELIKLSSRRYAKRQITWFRHEAEAVRICVDSDTGMHEYGEVLNDALLGIERLRKE